MLKFYVLEVLFVLVILFDRLGQSLKCYECRSDQDKWCNSDSLNEKLAIDCPKKNNVTTTYCRKIYQKLKFLEEKSFTEIRECAYEIDRSGCYKLKWLSLGHQETCECEKDYCNRGNSFKQNNFTVAVIFYIIWIINYLKTCCT